jgi:hypothetical protein
MEPDRPTMTYAQEHKLIQSLQRLRERVLERLDVLEALAREPFSCGLTARDSTELARTLELKRAELEEAERRICARVERQEKDWTASVTQLEADRRLLAEAWERIERERIAHRGTHEHHDCSHTQSPGRQKRASVVRPRADALAETRSGTVESESDTPAPQPILRQYQALCSDVRRNAVERRESP